MACEALEAALLAIPVTLLRNAGAQSASRDRLEMLLRCENATRENLVVLIAFARKLKCPNVSLWLLL